MVRSFELRRASPLRCSPRTLLLLSVWHLSEGPGRWWWAETEVLPLAAGLKNYLPELTWELSLIQQLGRELAILSVAFCS